MTLGYLLPKVGNVNLIFHLVTLQPLSYLSLKKGS